MRIKSGIKAIVVGVLILTVATICVPFYIVRILVRDSVDLMEFEVPGSAMVFVESPGRYYLWHDYRTVFDGRSYDHPAQLPSGLVIEITASDGERIDFVNDRNNSFTINSRARQSVGYVDLVKAGQLTFDVSGDVESRIFSFSPFSFGHFVGLIVKGVLSVGLAFLTAIGLIIWGIVQLAKTPRVPH